jgi:hypothetical protein
LPARFLHIDFHAISLDGGWICFGWMTFTTHGQTISLSLLSSLIIFVRRTNVDNECISVLERIDECCIQRSCTIKENEVQ